MPAQLIILGTFDAKTGTWSYAPPAGTTPQQGVPETGNAPQQGAPAPAPTPPVRKPKYPPHYPFPTGHAVVFGQEPMDLGEFKKMSSLFKQLGNQKKTPGGASRTVFATVADINKLKPKTIYGGLAKLPKELTIVVKPSEIDG